MKIVEATLQNIINDFNSRFMDWQITNNYGANIGFVYGSDGKKRLKILDVRPIPTDVPDKEDMRVKLAGDRLERELSSCGEGTTVQRHEGSDASKNEGSS